MASGGYDGTLVEADPYHEDSFGDEDGDGAMFVAFGFEFTSLALSVAVAMILVFLILSVLSIWYTCWVCRGHRMCGCSGLKEGGGDSFDGLPPVRTFSGETSSSAGGSRERSGSHAGSRSRSSCRSGPSGGLNRIAPARRAGGQVLGGGVADLALGAGCGGSLASSSAPASARAPSAPALPCAIGRDQEGGQFRIRGQRRRRLLRRLVGVISVEGIGGHSVALLPGRRETQRRAAAAP